MLKLRSRVLGIYARLGPRFMPFTDRMLPDLPVPALLRLSLFQISVGITLVLLVGTLNRVMIVELGLPATLVGTMIALPVLFAPFRTLIGYKSDTHRSELGWRRVPFIWRGTLLQFGGFAIMPFAILVLAGRGEAHDAPAWLGYGAAAVAFLLAGAGAHTVQTAGLALATDLTPPRSHARVVGFMYGALLVGMMASALVFGLALADFAADKLIRVIQGAALTCAALNLVAVWKQERRDHRRRPGAPRTDPSFVAAWRQFTSSAGTSRLLVVVGLGTMAFAMSEVLLEPYGGEILHWTVASTTRLTALLAFGSLLGVVFASRRLGAGGNAFAAARTGALIGIPALGLVIAAAPLQLNAAFVAANLMLGFGAALFSHSTLTATMTSAAHDKAGLALGTWGAVQATAAGAAMMLGAVIRDVVDAILTAAGGGLASLGGYVTVYAIEIGLLVAAVVALLPLLRETGSVPVADGSAGALPRLHADGR